MKAYFGTILLVCKYKYDRLVVPVLDFRILGGFFVVCAMNVMCYTEHTRFP